jgi:hypothetical protein
MNLLEVCGDDATTESICLCLKAGKLGEVFNKLSQKYSDSRHFGELFAKWAFEHICFCVSSLRKQPSGKQLMMTHATLMFSF